MSRFLPADGEAYLRAALQAQRKGKKRGGTCSICSLPNVGFGGWGLCGKHFDVARRRLLKQALVVLMGGKCERCSGVFPLSVYDFHHVGAKHDLPSYVIDHASVQKIAEEMSQCVLLCSNCHRKVHNDPLV